METIIVDIIRGLIGVSGLLAIAYALSSNRKKIHWPIVIGGILLQLVFASLFFLASGVSAVFQVFANIFVTTINFTQEGGRVIFGEVLFNEDEAASVFGVGRGFIFAFQVLPTIIFFSALDSCASPERRASPRRLMSSSDKRRHRWL